MASILAALAGALALRADQPIVENYVGRQIPTAMVARNLDAGSGFLHPTLDTAPFPRRFLVEPPIYALIVVGVKRGFGFVWEEILGRRDDSGWEPAGRLTSAAMTVLGAWAFWGLARRREGAGLALVALAAFALFPVTLRYGRAFQPDAMMLGFVLVGLRGWDEFAATGGRGWAWLGGLALGVGLAIKVTAAWALVPYFLLARRLPAWPRAAVGLAMLAPVLAWYLFAWNELRHEAVTGLPAAADAATAWSRALAPASWLRFATWEAVGRNLVGRAFTPLGFALAAGGWVAAGRRGAVDRLWVGWGVGVAAAVVALAAKWHHGYYWLAVAPVAAVGVAHGLAALARVGRPGLGRPLAAGLGLVLAGLAVAQAAPTWSDPPEWRSVRDLWRQLPTPVPNWIIIGPEAAIYYIGRPGYRLEIAPEAARRAAGEWGEPLATGPAAADPLALVDFYLARDAAGAASRPGALPHQRAAAGSGRVLVVDVGPVEAGSPRADWRAAVRRRPRARVWRDEPELLMVEVGDPACAPRVPILPPDEVAELRPIVPPNPELRP